MIEFDTDALQKKFHRTAIPIYQTVADFLREQIISGKISAGEKLPPEMAFSKSLGISFLTLRKSLKILTDEHLITQCRGKGTFVSFRTVEKITIGVVIPNDVCMEDDIFFMRFVTCLNEALNKHGGGELILLPFEKKSNFLEKIHQSRCNALIVLATDDSVYRELGKRIFSNIPAVFISSNKSLPENCKKQYVIYMMRGAVRDAVERLFRMGHRRIGFFSGHFENLRHPVDNEEEFVKTCSDLGISSEYMRICEDENWFKGVFDQACAMMKSSDRPTAVIAPGFTFSYAAWQAVQVSGLRIPEDISFIGFDVNRNSNPFMSAMLHSTAEAMNKAIEIILRLRNTGKKLKEHQYEIPAIFQDNGSCKEITEN